jgi:Fe-S oxidoreductase
MATLKSEFLFQYHKSNSISLRSKLIANISRLNSIASKFSGIHNTLINQGWLKSWLGIAKKRSLPKLYKHTLRHWYKKNKTTFEKTIASKQVVYLFCDEYTNYYDVEIGIKTIKLLNSCGYKVMMVAHAESGRAYISKGFLKQAKNIANRNISIFKDLISVEVPLLGIEPSAILSFRDEYPNLVEKDAQSTAIALSKHVFLIDEFISNEIESGNIDASLFTSEEKDIVLHGHCHQKALSSTNYTETLLSLPANYKVEVLPTGCCGMAGSFGYEKEHFNLSMDIGNMVLFPKIRIANKNKIIAAPGTSCRHQIKDGTERESFHPVEILYNALKTE